MAVFVTHGAIELQWCERCLTMSLAVVGVYVLAGDSVHQAGRLVVGCVSCDEV